MAGLGGDQRVGNILYILGQVNADHPLFRDGTYYPTNAIHLSLRRSSSVFPQEEHRSAASNKMLLMDILCKSAAHLYYDSTTHQEIVTERLRTLPRVRQDLLANFQAPPVGDPPFFHHSKEKLWKLMNFNVKVLTKSAVFRRFAIPNYFDSVYYSESSDDFVVVGGPDIVFRKDRFREMVQDCMSMMVMFANYELSQPGQRPPHNSPFSNDVPRTFQLFCDYLDLGLYVRYDRRAAFDFQYFWSYKDQDEFARFSAEQYEYNSYAYGFYADSYLPFGWSSQFPVGSHLHTQYLNSQALRNPPDYRTPGKMPWFVHCSVEHIKLIYAERQMDRAYVLDAMDALFQYSYRVFITNLEFATFALDTHFQRPAYLPKLGFRYVHH